MMMVNQSKENKSSIKKRLMKISLLTTIIALILTGLALTVREVYSYHAHLAEKLRIQAEIIGNNVKAALTFNDPKSANETLSSLAADRHVSYALLYNQKNKLVALYVKDLSKIKTGMLPTKMEDDYYYDSSRALIIRPIHLDDEKIGEIYIESDLEELYDRIYMYGAIVFVLIIISSVIAFLLLLKLQQVITKPVTDIAQLMHDISIEKDYAVRAKAVGDQELDLVVDSFNDMLSQIQKRDEELEEHHVHLQDMVAKRTSELAETNESLRYELVERKKVEEELSSHKNHLDALINSSTDLVYLKDQQFRYLLVNRAMQTFLGVEMDRILGRTDFEILPNDTAQHIRTVDIEAVRSEKPVEKEQHLAKMDFSIVAQKVVDDKDQIIGIAAVYRNITDYKRLQDQLRQSQKMEAIGQLAGGVAHDFNNILTAIIGYATLLQMRMQEERQPLLEVDQILTSAERAASLTQGLLAFSRKQVIKKAPASINNIVNNIEKLLRRLIGEDIEFKTILSDDDLVCMVDTTQIEQVLLNLSANARDAMHDTGMLTIKTERVLLDDNYVKFHGLKKGGQYALISVSDTGEGMDETTIERIFEPFFTTKEMGRGTGLGLSIVYGVVNQHDGFIHVYSEPGSGTNFKIYLPLRLTGEEFEEIKVKPVQYSEGKNETLLVAEDQFHVREMMKKLLVKFGYNVILAEDGEDAVERFKANANTVDMVILDVIMPKKNGKEACDEIKKLRPDMKVLFASGYTADILQKRGIAEGDINFITKPVMPQDLLKKIREVLEA
jgi:PAS domain S-box-containing protein